MAELCPRKGKIPMTPADLRTWRGSRTQHAAARILAAPVGTYRNWEHGRRKIPHWVERMIELLEAK